MSVEELITQVRTLWKFDYEPKVKALRDLYEVAKKEQWNAGSDYPRAHSDCELRTSAFASGAPTGSAG